MVNIRPMKIPGGWREGYVLDYHTSSSTFLGHNEFGNPEFDTQRTEIGELLYRLKYRSDKTVVPTITHVAASFVRRWSPPVNILVPVPPSRSRSYQPVVDLAGKLSAELQIRILPDSVRKVTDTKELKDVYEYHKRSEILEGAFLVERKDVEGQAVLVFDDLYRSGATLNAITNLLYRDGNAADVYALALTQTRSKS